jgi:hypothetical protein
MIEVKVVKQISSAERAQLIEEVRMKDAIWNNNDPNHANRQILTKMWLDIKSIMDT